MRRDMHSKLPQTRLFLVGSIGQLKSLAGLQQSSWSLSPLSAIWYNEKKWRECSKYCTRSPQRTMCTVFPVRRQSMSNNPSHMNIPGARSQELLARRQQFVARGVGVTMSVFAAKADGAIIEDVDGNRFIDFAGGIGT